MKNLREILTKKSFTLSIELFPPKKSEGLRYLLEKTVPSTLSIKCGLQPDFYSVTYGAGSVGVSNKTLDTVKQIKNTFGTATVMHITRAKMNRAGIIKTVREAHQSGISDFLALGGDGAHGSGNMKYAKDVVMAIKTENPHSTVGVAGFPEGNNAFTDSAQTNWDYLIEKIKSGADFVITQLFFENEYFLRFRDYVSKRLQGDFPIIAGIMPVTSYNQLDRFVEMTGAEVPQNLRDIVKNFKDDGDALRAHCVQFAVEQSEKLLAEKVSGLHYYCLNRSQAVTSIMDKISGLIKA